MIGRSLGMFLYLCVILGAGGRTDAAEPARDANARSLGFTDRVNVCDGPEDAQKATKPVRAAIETTFATSKDQIRQFAFDGDPATYFLSAKNVQKADHFTLVFDQPVEVTAVQVITGRPNGPDRLDEGTLEISEDGQTFKEAAKFADGAAGAKFDRQKVRAVRIQPSADLEHPLAIREFTITSSPVVAVFKYPVEYVMEGCDDAALKPVLEKVVRACEHDYSRIAELMQTPGFKPPTVVRISFNNRIPHAPANFAAGTDMRSSRMYGSVAFIRSKPDEVVGAFLHETVHAIQRYRIPASCPVWLSEGIACYVYHYRYRRDLDSTNAMPKPPRPDRAKYNASYDTTAAFLAFLTEKYDREIVDKLNQQMREGAYKEEIFHNLTNKTFNELEQEWKASLAEKKEVDK